MKNEELKIKNEESFLKEVFLKAEEGSRTVEVVAFGSKEVMKGGSTSNISHGNCAKRTTSSINLPTSNTQIASSFTRRNSIIPRGIKILTE